MASKQKSGAIKRPPPSPVKAVLLGGGMGRDLANWLFPTFLLMILAGFWGIWRFGMPPGNPNPIRALFMAINAATLTGFNENPGIGGLTSDGQHIVLGLIVVGSLFSTIVGSLAVVRIVGLPFSDGQVIFAALLAEAAALVVGMATLGSADRANFQSLFLSASAFGNCGLFVGDLPRVSSLAVHLVILPLCVLGGLGIPVLMELWSALATRKPLSKHARAVIFTSAWLYVIGFVLLLALDQAGSGRHDWTVLRTQIPASSVLSLESRSGGMAIAPLSATALPARWVLMVLMAIGASSGGTGGGLKTTTVVELFRGTRRIFRGEAARRSFAIAFVWLIVYVAMILGAVLLLTYVGGGEAPDNVLFNAISGISNTGFSLAQTPDQKNVLFAYSAIMLLGRMAPLMVLWWMAETVGDGELAIG